MTEIPVTFNYNGKAYHGKLVPVNGAAKENASVFNLMFDGYYCGKLFSAQYHEKPHLPVDLSKSLEYRWRFGSQIEEFEELAEFFGDVVAAWYQ